MDPYSTWDDLVPNQRARPPPPDDDFSQYFTEYKNFDNLFNEALTTLQDLDVPSGYTIPTAPSQAVSTPFRHAKKPSGTAIFGFVDHNRELSLNGQSSDVYRMTRPATEAVRSILPSHLAKRQLYHVSHDQLDFNFSQPLEECKPILLDENDEEEAPPKKEEDIIVTNKHPKSYKFPPDAGYRSRSPSTQNYDEFLTTPISAIHHPKQTNQYPEDIDVLLADTKTKKYVPIPVQKPVPDLAIDQKKSFQPGISPQLMVKQQQQSPAHLPLRAQQSDTMKPVEMLNMNMNVYLPPPSTSLSHGSPEPHSPLPGEFSSPVQHRTAPVGAATSASPYEKRTFYNPQFFSDDAELYYQGPPDQYQTPMHNAGPSSLNSSPIKGYNESFNDDTIADANETILQLTPLKNQAPMTPQKKPITLEWSPIISPNAKANTDVRRAIQELSPRRVIKKTSLLPPGELDKYWEGPDENKVFTCTYKNCNKKFTRRYNVRSHIQTHLSDRPFSCSYCSKNFVRQHDLNRHVKSHLLSKHCKCSCGKEFTRVEGYRKHLSNGICSRAEVEGGVLKPSHHKLKGQAVLDGLTSNRLNEELGL